MTSPETHAFYQADRADECGFTYWPGSNSVEVVVTAADGRPTVSAEIPWADFWRMINTMMLAYNQTEVSDGSVEPSE
jgi:hypothetical protein